MPLLSMGMAIRPLGYQVKNRSRQLRRRDGLFLLTANFYKVLSEVPVRNNQVQRLESLFF